MRPDPAHKQQPKNALELAIGLQVKHYRTQLGMTVIELAKLTGLSVGMLSKVENGQTSPSLSTLQSLASALDVPVASLFKKFEDSERSVVHVRSGEGLNIERQGTRAGHQYALLGHSVHDRINIEPYLITISKPTDVFPVFQHEGVEFLYMLEGEMTYRVGNNQYPLSAGDSLYFDSQAPHGPEDLLAVPIRFLSFIVGAD